MGRQMRCLSPAAMLACAAMFLTSYAARPAAQASQATASPTFYKDVLPILQKNCQGCHRPGQIAPFRC